MRRLALKHIGCEDLAGFEGPLREGARRYGAGLAARGRGFLEAWLGEMSRKY